MKFTESHEWIELKGDIATIGITDHAQKELGEIVFVELPKLGYSLKAGDVAVVVESTKAAVDIYSPISGKVQAVNTALTEDPGVINRAAEGAGWLFKMKLDKTDEIEFLMDAPAYKNFIQSK